MGRPGTARPRVAGGRPISAERLRARAARRRAGRIRLAVLLASLGLVIALIVTLVGGGGSPLGRAAQNRPGATGVGSRGGGAAGGAGGLTASQVPAIEAGLLPWPLNSPLSRSVVLPAADGRSLVVAGGLYAEGGSAQGVYQVDPSTGAATEIGQLTAPLHDSAGAVIAGKGYVFGGGDATVLPVTERLASLGAPTGSSPSSQAKAATLPSLPAPRADDSAVAIGGTAYVIGGYDGSAGDAAVLSTTDGTRYSVVADLPVPVRYAAVGALNGKIYVFGGDATSGPSSGYPVSTVQVVDPASHSASIVGSLPEPIDGAAAATLDGNLYVAGGETGRESGATSSTAAVSAIWAWLPGPERAAAAGHLPVAVSHAGIAVIGSRAWVVGGETAPNVESSDVQMFEPNRAFGTAGTPGAGTPYFGDKLLIADRGNDRLLLVDDTGKIIWTYPSATEPAPPGGFYFPDDAFFTHRGTEILSNQESNETLVQLAYPSGKVLWTYGHPRQAGSAPGYLNNPDDAYLLADGDISVADPMNCRVLVLSPTSQTLSQIGTPGECTHAPPHALGSPNGDTPLANGDLLVSEINGSWIDEYTVAGKLVWTTQLQIGYPSDPQPLGADRYLVADYETPGAFVEFNRAGKILYKYGPSSGPGELNRPSLVEMLPSGVLMSNDDYNNRMVAVDPVTGALVWQYGQTGVAGTAPGLLNTPDGFDLVGPGGTFPTHPATG